MAAVRSIRQRTHYMMTLYWEDIAASVAVSLAIFAATVLIVWLTWRGTEWCQRRKEVRRFRKELERL